MKKINRRFEVEIDVYLYWCTEVSIEDIRHDLDMLEEKGATHIEMETSGGHIGISAIKRRIETNEEYQQRLSEMNSREESIKKRELRQLANLKNKYEKQN